jgi:uncharacterized protein with GYD domain
MPTYVMLTRLSPEVLQSPKSLEDLERLAMERIRSLCPQVEWRSSFAVMGPYDYVDIFTAPDNETAIKVSALIRTFGRAHSEVWPATEWTRFKEIMHSLV